MERWQQFNRREQGVLLLTAGVLALLLLWLIIVQPLRAMVADQHADNRMLADQLQQARTMAGQLQQLKQSGANSSRAGANNLQRLVGQTARSHGLVMSDFRPNSDNSLQLRFEQAPFNGLLEWLYQLEASHNVAVDNLDISPTRDSGLVSVSIRLRSR